MRTTTRYTIRSVGPALVASVVALGGLGTLVGASLELLRAPARPPPEALPALALASLPLTWSATLPLAAMLGLSAGLWRWRRDGQWATLRASGVGGGALLRPGLPFALALAILVSALTHRVEPAARAATKQALSASLQLVPGRLVSVGPLTLLADAVDGEALRGVSFALEGAEGEVVGGAARAGRLTPEALELSGGRLHHPGPPDVQLDFERLRLRLEPAERRVELVEKGSAELAGLISRMRADGKNAGYEQAVLAKRWSWPVACALLLLACPPLVLGGRPAAVVALPLVYWSMVRGMDGLARELGGGLAAWAPALALAALVSALWWRWEER